MTSFNEIIVTTVDLKQEYEVIGPVYFQVSNKGLFSSALSKLIKEYKEEIEIMKSTGSFSVEKMDWGFLYGEWSVGQNNFDKAFYIAVQELKKRAAFLGADAIVGMRQDIDLDTTDFQFFYLQMYGTAVKFR
ncbi:putative heavy-metal-binding protein [Hydrogenispora ethanolica]|uniref:Putative heavy-metal-binding protein n=1 Tax=Hydrogenispora ethanolica TaxID=1082276 RepID=A0A4R1RC20_HYDET|nr:heavy metal-binding domain-containing protein [Hydrogenispora ethanolica]TCL63374.1 putative heavy-metal-binding protein [Hydrogenispora ethanolica]